MRLGLTSPAAAAPFTSPTPLPPSFPQEGDVAHFGMRLDGCQAERCWEEVLASSGFAARKAAAEAHNAGQ